MRPGEGAGYGLRGVRRPRPDRRGRARRLRRRPRPAAGRPRLHARPRAARADRRLGVHGHDDDRRHRHGRRAGRRGGHRRRAGRGSRSACARSPRRSARSRTSCCAASARGFSGCISRRRTEGRSDQTLAQRQRPNAPDSSVKRASRQLGSGTAGSMEAMKQKTVFACQECGAQSAKWLGPLRRVRRVELAGRGARLRRRRPAAPATRSATASRVRRAAALRGHRHGRGRAAVDRHRRVRPRARRRRRARLAGADRRRAGHRQVDAAAAGGGALRQDGRPGALQLRRRVRAPDQVARRAAGRRARAALHPGRDLPRADPRGDRPAAARRS